MTRTICLKIMRTYLLGLSLMWLLNGLFLVSSGDSHYLFNRPVLGNVVLFSAIFQYNTTKGWNKFFLWAVVLGAILVWILTFSAIFPNGLTLSRWQVLGISLISVLLADLAHLGLNKLDC